MLNTALAHNGLSTPERRSFYRDHGYLVIEDALSAAEVDELQGASERLQSERAKLGSTDRLAVIQNVTLMDDAFMRAAQNPVLLDVVKSLIGDNLRLQHCKLNWKPPSHGTGEVQWHQDFPFFPHSNFDLLACMFLLDDAVVENGCMRVIPGSHREGLLDHIDGKGTFVGHVTNLGEADERDAVDFIVKAGTMTVHHCLTLHASYPNFSDTPRRGLVYQIAAGDAIQLGGNLHKVWGTMLAGADPQLARLENGTSFRLPSPLVNRGGLDPADDWRQATDD